MIAFSVLLSLALGPRVAYSLEFDKAERTYYLRVRNLRHEPTAVYREAEGYQLSFLDREGKEVKPPIRLTIEKSGPSARSWALLSYLDEAAVRLDTDTFQPDPRVAYLNITLNERFLKNASKFAPKEALVLTEINSVSFAVHGLGGGTPTSPR